MHEAEISYKICIFGDSGVGKTSLTNRYLTNMFDEDTKKTLGASIHIKYLKVECKKISLQIWDFGGEDKFKFLLPAYSKGSFGGIYMYDITRVETLLNYEVWISVFKSGLFDNYSDIPMLLVGGKKDLDEERNTYREDISEVLDTGIFFGVIECSAKTGENVEKIFVTLVKKIIEDVRKRKETNFHTKNN